MSLHLDRIDAAPVIGNQLDYPLVTWMAVLVNVLNENLQDIENALFSPIIVLDTTQVVDLNNIYIPTNVAMTTFQMPAMCSVGDRVTIAGFGAGGWQLLNGAGQTIHAASVGGTATTSITSTSAFDSIELICVEENLTWITLTTQTTGFVIV